MSEHKSQSTRQLSGQPLEVASPRFSPGIEPQLPNRQTINRPPKTTPKDGQWWEHSMPFNHFTATDVLDNQTYEQLCHEFSAIQETTAGKHEGKYKMRKAQGNNDGLMLGLTDELASTFSPLFTKAWLRSIAELMGIKFLPRVEGALHHNPQSSRTGWIHTDCCSAWFDESDGKKDELILPPRGRCSYFTGYPKVPYAEPTEYIRAATLIFYLCNDEWEQGDGGETGLYGAAQEIDNTPVKLIPPRNNSLILFECSPHSYHRFVTNPGRARNSIILWLHSHVDDAEARWGTAINRPAML